jgi:uncharacterized protein YjiK
LLFPSGIDIFMLVVWTFTMRPILYPLTFCSILAVTAGVSPGGDPAPLVPPSRYDFPGKPALTLNLPPSLREVSGLAISADGRIFAHNDERGTVYQVDPSNGNMLKQFAVGERRLRGDFEDIALVGDTFYFASSGGSLFKFREGRDRENVEYVEFVTPLRPENNVEGLCHDPETGGLLMACKESPRIGGGNGGAPESVRAVYAFDLERGSLTASPRFRIDLRILKTRFGLKDFRPSGIARHPLTGNFFVISALGNSIVELSPAGAIVSCAHLNKRYNSQPEGIAFDSEGTLYIANEGKKRGTIVVYRPLNK